VAAAFLQMVAGYWSKGINKDGDEGYFQTSYIGRLQLVSSLWDAFHFLLTLSYASCPARHSDEGRLQAVWLQAKYSQGHCIYNSSYNRQVSFH